ncbi:hypothetical protein JTE90_026275 [Oedothorax gibbosus]|uniref:Centromere protein J C-terminal domain-containing protein n=1 Tax=Oedothorax gibbosus TaxID=931172 RepID=A0AAV6U2H9_9ARAC|nr:hypothetical protein JTE90_026275 [Oedothorax gibbosus]
MESLQVLNGLKISDAKKSIFEELKKMRQWQDSQRQEFQNKQLMEHRKLLEETEMNIGKYYSLNKEIFGLSDNSTTDQSQSASDVSFPDQSSSIYGHMQNCFSDDSYDNTPVGKNKRDPDIPVGPISNGGFSSLSDISSQTSHVPEQLMEDVRTAVPKQPAGKRPFLRKGDGLARYKPKNKSRQVGVPKPLLEQKAEIQIPQRKVVLKLKPALHTKNSPPRKTNHVKFCEPIQVFDHETNHKQLFDESTENSESEIRENGVEEIECTNINAAQNQELKDNSFSSDISLNTESKELAEFEMLENCAQNSSFNSDSSVVQRVLNGEALKPIQKPSSSHSNFRSPKYIRPERKVAENPVDFTKNLDSRKQRLEDFISNFEPKIASLHKEVTTSNAIAYDGYGSDDEKRCSTPVDDNDALSECDSSKNSSLSSVILAPYSVAKNKQHNLFEDDEGDSRVKLRMDRHLDKKNDNADIAKQNENMDKGPIEKSKLREKMGELQKEIENYQADRAQLALISKERDMILKQLTKERDDFQKYKEEEMKKFHSEMESQKQQFKREKETFNRLKKVTKDYRNRKEHEGLSTLKQEVENLQKELKKEKIKFNNETRRLKSQLASAEKERDNYKLHNMTLEDQIEDLVATLKVRMALQGISETKDQVKGNLKAKNKSTVSNGRKGSSDNQENKIYSDSSDNFKDVQVNLEPINIESNTKPKVHFNLSPQHKEKSQSSILRDSGFSSSNDKYIENSRGLYGDFVTQAMGDSNFEKLPYEEVQHHERIEEEINFSSGTHKHINADGETIKFLYSNGDEKETFPDGSTVYKFVNGDIERSFPNGLVISYLLNGQIQKKNPDESIEVIFPDGSHHFTYVDGTQEITNKDGTKVRIDPDGTQTIEFTNGEREIRKKDYKRREYPNGSAKTIYASGRQETRYANGRIKIKGVDGKLVLDTKLLGLADKVG